MTVFPVIFPVLMSRSISIPDRSSRKDYPPRTGKPVRYYNFDIQSTNPAPVYVLYREGEDKPVADQLDIIDTLPGEKGYNDFRQVWKVSVPKDYVANTVTDAASPVTSRLQVGKNQYAA